MSNFCLLYKLFKEKVNFGLSIYKSAVSKRNTFSFQDEKIGMEENEPDQDDTSEDSNAEVVETFDFDKFIETYKEYMAKEKETTVGKQHMREAITGLVYILTMGSAVILHAAYITYRTYQYGRSEGYDFTKRTRIEEVE